jgi:hypothetical protein
VSSYVLEGIVSMMESRTIYFEDPGSQNTEDVLGIARDRAKELGIPTILIASKTGDTAIKALEVLKGLKLMFIGDSTGFKEPDVQTLTDEKRKIVEGHGGIYLNTTHTFAGINRALKLKMNTYGPEAIIANTLRIFGQGVKVACEIAMMAADNGLVRTDEDVICIAGTRKGADTAVVLKPVHTHHFFDLKIKEILCKPHF